MNFYILMKITDWLTMAKITLNNLSHSYVPDYTDADLVLRDINIIGKMEEHTLY